MGGVLADAYGGRHEGEPRNAVVVASMLALTVVAPMLGIARAALDLALATAARKPMPLTVYERLADSPSVQLAVADAASLVDTAQLHAYRAADDLDHAAAEAGSSPWRSGPGCVWTRPSRGSAASRRWTGSSRCPVRAPSLWPARSSGSGATWAGRSTVAACRASKHSPRSSSDAAVSGLRQAAHSCLSSRSVGPLGRRAGTHRVVRDVLPAAGYAFLRPTPTYPWNSDGSSGSSWPGAGRHSGMWTRPGSTRSNPVKKERISS